ncbi:helix-turn-helix domain-containing protein [Tenacibaculum litopenaei]|jgi:AraC-like DNA-binding protein|uniref:helix-turn-helix domain-containing protein n=1 Tax=Tenacibaculum litopenaei TaxID=396016 RepID=UPI0038B468D8
MKFTQLFPTICTLLGLFLSFFILSTRNNFTRKKVVKKSLLLIVVIYTLLSITTFLEINRINTPLFVDFIFFIIFHFVGISFLYFSSTLINRNVNFKPYLLLLGITALCKVVFFSYAVRILGDSESYYELLENVDSPIIQYGIYDYMMSCLINIFFIYRAFVLFTTQPLLIELDTKKDIYLRWVRWMLLINIGIIIAMFVQVLLLLFKMVSFKLVFTTEPILYTLYFFVFIYSLMYFPVFAFTGDYNDLPENERKKYQRSSLNNSLALFEKINDLVLAEKLYLSSELKINNLASRLDTSVPHISQAINENKQVSFSDYINGFRIEEAKKKLLEEKPDTIFAISLDVGFNSKATFYHAFKKLTQQTPTQYRKTQLSSNS